MVMQDSVKHRPLIGVPRPGAGCHRHVHHKIPKPLDPFRFSLAVDRDRQTLKRWWLDGTGSTEEAAQTL